MKLKVIQVGHSKGIRLPKALLEQCGIEEELEVVVDGSTLLLSPVRTQKKSRVGWAELFEKEAAKEKKEENLWGVLDDTNLKEWTWE